MQLEFFKKQGKHLKQAYYVQGMHASKGDISLSVVGKSDEIIALL